MGDDDADEVVSLQPEIARRDVRGVADAGGGFEDETAFFRAQPGGALQCTVDRPDGDSGQFGNFFSVSLSASYPPPSLAQR